MQIETKKKLVAGLSITSNITLTVLKVVIGVLSGSLSILSEAIHSMSDFLASVLTFFSVVKSSQPADSEYPFGHGKYEEMAGFIEGLLIILASLLIVNESAKNIINGVHAQLDDYSGIFVMSLAVIMNIIVSSLLFKVAKESCSISLYADGEHLRTDIYSSLGVLAGLILIKITGYNAIDSIVAIIVAIVIFKAGFNIIKESGSNLLDHSLPQDQIDSIKRIVNLRKNTITLKEGSLKARQVGPTKDIVMTLQFSGTTSICECHKICDELEQQLMTLYPNSSITIHSEPLCYHDNCKNSCAL